MHAAHKAGMGIGVMLLVVMTTAAMFVGHKFYKQTSRGLHFHYFKVCVCIGVIIFITISF